MKVKCATCPVWGIHLQLILYFVFREHSGKSALLEIEGLQVGASPASLCCVCERHINPCLVLVQPRKTRPNITEKCSLGRK